MKVLCVRQPWAHAIIYGKKNVENRTWATTYRGPMLIAASAGKITARRWELIQKYLAERKAKIELSDLQYGGIIGMVELAECLDKDSRLKEGDTMERYESFQTVNNSKWAQGPVYWVLRKPKPLPFIPIKRTLGLFDPSPNVKAKLKKLDVL